MGKQARLSIWTRDQPESRGVIAIKSRGSSRILHGEKDVDRRIHAAAWRSEQHLLGRCGFRL